MVSTDDDLKLHAQLFKWPEKMDPIFEVSQKRLVARRERAEKEVKEKKEQFEQMLKDFEEQTESFKEKEVRIWPVHLLPSAFTSCNNYTIDYYTVCLYVCVRRFLVILMI